PDHLRGHDPDPQADASRARARLPAPERPHGRDGAPRLVARSGRRRARQGLRMTALPAEMRGLLEARNFAHLATTLPDGSPHSVPVWIGVEGEHVVFFTQPGSRKARN